MSLLDKIFNSSRKSRKPESKPRGIIPRDGHELPSTIPGISIVRKLDGNYYMRSIGDFKFSIISEPKRLCDISNGAYIKVAEVSTSCQDFATLDIGIPVDYLKNDYLLEARDLHKVLMKKLLEITEYRVNEFYGEKYQELYGYKIRLYGR